MHLICENVLFSFSAFRLFASSGGKLRPDTTYAVQVPGGATGQRRLIPVSGQPKFLPGSDSSPLDSSRDLAVLILEKPVAERADGACFLCLPVQQSIPEFCFTGVGPQPPEINCRVIASADFSPAAGRAGAVAESKWSAYAALPALTGNNSECRTAAGSGNGGAGPAFCVSNVGTASKWCAGKSAPMICDQAGIIRYSEVALVPLFMQRTSRSPNI